MAFLQTTYEKKSFWTTAFILLAVLLLLFFAGLRYLDPLPENGILIAFGNIDLSVHCGVTQFGTLTLKAPYHEYMSGPGDMTWFEEDMDGDGRLNGPGDWDSDGDGIPDSPGGDSQYDAVIRNYLGLSDDQPIPKPKHKYPFNPSGGTFSIQVKGDDLKYWDDFWTLTPPKAGAKVGTTSKGSGDGEISLYWLYQHSDSGVEARGTQGSDNPDLEFNGVGVEVKAYGKPNGVIDLGRFGKFRDNLKMLNTVFGIAGLAATFDGNVEDQKQKNALTWAGSDLKAAFEQAHTLSQVDLEQIADIWPIFKDIKANIDYLDSQLGGFSSAEEGAKKLTYKFIGDKLARKPGWGGHLADMSINGFIRFWHIDQGRFENYDDILGKATIGASQGAMKLHFNKIFG